jgi:creatinine amidohydrolase/Fe(II)-dependent formamide hydrolase-like protein
MSSRIQRTTFRLEEVTIRELSTILESEEKKWGVLLPVGSLEQHGPFLPFGCDMALARGAAENLALALVDNPHYGAFVLPDFPFTPSPGAEETQGTISTSFDWLGAGLKEIIRSVVKTPWTFVGIINGHAHNHGRVIEASMAGADGQFGRKLPVVVLNMYEFTFLSRDCALNPGSHAGEFEIALYDYYARFRRCNNDGFQWSATRPRPASIYGLDIRPRSVEGIISDRIPDIDKALEMSSALGTKMDHVIYESLTANLDTYFQHWQ